MEIADEGEPPNDGVAGNGEDLAINENEKQHRFIREVLRRSYMAILNDLEPALVLDVIKVDCTFGEMTKMKVRDLQETPSTSEKNRQIYRIFESNPIKYVAFKSMMARTGQDGLLEKIESVEAEYHAEIKAIRKKVTALYERYCQRVPIYPLRPSWKVRVEDLYVKPHMVVVDPRGRHVRHYSHDRSHARGHQDVGKVQDLFYSDGKLCHDIYVDGEAGKGKSSLCEHLVSLWVKSQTGPRPLLEDESFMNMFTFLFYISLREANRTFKECHRVDAMVVSQLQLSSCDVSKLMSDYYCLIIMDGLDELTLQHGSEFARFGSQNLPERIYSDKCIYLTTSRPFKLELLARELEGTIDRQISIVGLEESSQWGLANNVVSLLNNEHGRDKSAEQFMSDLQEQRLTQYLNTPVLLMQMLGLWYSGKPLGNSQCAIYSNIVEKQIEFAERVRGLPKEEKPKDAICQDQLPSCFTNHPFCHKYKSVLFQVSKLAYERLFDKNREHSLIFDHDQTEICGMDDDEVKLLLHMGILTQHKVFGEITEELKSISFLHKSHQEFFCAVHLSTKCQRSELTRLFTEVISGLDHVLELENIFLFVCGMNAEVAANVSAYIMEKVSSDARVQDYRQTLEDDDSWQLVRRIQEIIIAGTSEARKNRELIPDLKLHDIFVLNRDDASRTERVFACDTSLAKSIYMKRPGEVRTWPPSPCVEKIYLLYVNIEACDVFVQNFAMGQLSILQLHAVDMTHNQLDCLCRSLSSTGNLRQVKITFLDCITHLHSTTECVVQLDFSQHKRLEKLSLSDLHVGEIRCVRLCKESLTCTDVLLKGVRISAAGFRKVLETLPEKCMKVCLESVLVNGMRETKNMLSQFIHSHYINVMEANVSYDLTSDECVVTRFLFYKKKVKSLASQNN